MGRHFCSSAWFLSSVLILATPLVLTHNGLMSVAKTTPIILPTLQPGDVGPYRVLGPPDTVHADSVYLPIATVANFGQNSVGSFAFVCSIDSTEGPEPIYCDTQMVSGLAGGDTITQYFEPWTVPQSGAWFYMTVFTDYPADTFRQNDTLRGRIDGPRQGVAEGQGELANRAAFRLFQARPNPSSQITDVRYRVPEPKAGRRTPERVSLRIYDVAGRLVKGLVDGEQGPGTYSVRWDGRDERGRMVPSGIYFCCFEAGGTRASRKLVALR